jgi:hypothetical protein
MIARGEPIYLGDPTVTRGTPRTDSAAILVADVDSIEVFAFAGERDPFWTSTLVVADVLSDTASTEGWTLDDVGWTFRHELQYGEDSYYPPLGTVRLEYVLHLASGALKTVTREAVYIPGRAVHGGYAVP